MSIRKKLMLSNIAIVTIPILSILFIDMLLGIIMLVILDVNQTTFAQVRMGSIIVVFIITSIIVTSIFSKHIVRPILHLNEQAKVIAKGNLNNSLVIDDRNDEIGELTESFENMRKSLKSSREVEQTAIRNRQVLMAGISHDLKTPLTSIKGYVNGIRDGVANTPEKQAQYTSVILQSVKRMETMIDDLFIYSKLEMKDINFNLREINLSDFLNDVIDVYRPRLSDKDALIFSKIDSGITVKGDPEQLYRAFSNVLDNSIKYSKDKVNIELRTSRIDQKVIISVSDNGIGIRENEMNKLFDSFYRAEHSRNSKTGGSGLGLAIVKEIIEKHGGTVELESDFGVGTTVIITMEVV
ncbi:HAMP domain-containing histidine kinase [Jeotgalicoccus huakuii]|nr:HAMP domain-containing histidine kinase [Jeotgalicoccus huakuii]